MHFIFIFLVLESMQCLEKVPVNAFSLRTCRLDRLSLKNWLGWLFSMVKVDKILVTVEYDKTDVRFVISALYDP
jgi:hypothetical protein